MDRISAFIFVVIIGVMVYLYVLIRDIKIPNPALTTVSNLQVMKNTPTVQPIISGDSAQVLESTTIASKGLSTIVRINMSYKTTTVQQSVALVSFNVVPFAGFDKTKLIDWKISARTVDTTNANVAAINSSYITTDTSGADTLKLTFPTLFNGTHNFELTLLYPTTT